MNVPPADTNMSNMRFAQSKSAPVAHRVPKLAVPRASSETRSPVRPPGAIPHWPVTSFWKSVVSAPRNSTKRTPAAAGPCPPNGVRAAIIA